MNDEAESKEAQDLFEQLGFTWAGDYPENGDWYSHLYAEKSTCCHLPIYVWNGLGDTFQELTLPQLRDLVAQSKNEQGLISGADAKMAWAKGDELQIRETGTTEWKPLTDKYALMVFDYERYELRLKPRTIKLSLEIPAPFEPKDGEVAWCLDGNTLTGHKKVIFDDFIDSGIGFWRTEEEIKQVVAALRGGIKG